MSDTEPSEPSGANAEAATTNTDAVTTNTDAAASNIEATLREFVDTLGESETYQRFVAADEALKDDAEAMALLREYRQKQAQMQRGSFDKSVMQELKELQSELSDNKTIQRQQAAQKELVELLQETNDVISEEISREFAQSTGGGCC